MLRLTKKGKRKVGLPPGTLVPSEEEKYEKIRITVIDYNETEFQEEEIEKIEQCFPFKDKPTVTWINIDGINDTVLLGKIGEEFGIHPLTLEDITDIEHRPKIEDFEDYIYVVLKMLLYNEKETEVQSEQVSLILGENYVISFQERKGDIFDPIRDRIRTSKGRIRKMGADYLAYTLLDTLVDNYFIVPEKIGEKIESLENELITDPTSETLLTIQNLKTKLIFLRKSVWPLREVIRAFEKIESPLIKDSTDIYLRDVYDHTIQLIDTIETSRDILTGMLDIYLSSLSNKMNQVMKVLTIIATIFIPLTFVAGIYGMNFRYMPELEWKWSYPVVLLIMVFIGIVMLFYFRKKKWL